MNSVTLEAQWERGRLYLYNSGNEYTSTTGGWGIDGWNTQNWNATGTKYSTYNRIHSPRLNYGELLGTTNAIDITGYSKIYVNIKAITSCIAGNDCGHITFTIAKDPFRGGTTYTDFAIPNRTGLVSFDLSALNSSYNLWYIATWATNTRGYEYDMLYLE